MSSTVGTSIKQAVGLSVTKILLFNHIFDKKVMVSTFTQKQKEQFRSISMMIMDEFLLGMIYLCALNFSDTSRENFLSSTYIQRWVYAMTTWAYTSYKCPEKWEIIHHICCAIPIMGVGKMLKMHKVPQNHTNKNSIFLALYFLSGSFIHVIKNGRYWAKKKGYNKHAINHVTNIGVVIFLIARLFAAPYYCRKHNKSRYSKKVDLIVCSGLFPIYIWTVITVMKVGVKLNSKKPTTLKN